MPNNEVEVKILNIDTDKIIQELLERGAEVLQPRTLFKEAYFDTLHKKESISTLRLRDEGGKVYLTVKTLPGKLSNSFLKRVEHEAEVSSYEKIREILEILGFKEFRSRQKYRQSFKINNCKVEIDEYPKMKPYLEIEAKNETDLRNFMKTFNIPFAISTNMTATQIIEKAGLNPNNLVF